MGRLPTAIGLIGIGWYFATCIVLGVLGGVWLDSIFDRRPLFTMLGLVLGLVLAGYGGYRMLVELVLKAPSDRGKGDGQP
ncbi:MAG: AtpZ/AtpI family protein [Dehalococcoidia bacterium]